MNVARILEQSAHQHPGRTALVFKDRQWTFAELDQAASRLASGLRALGLKAGSRIGLHLPNSPAFVAAYYAANKIGVIPIALNVTYAADEIAYIAGDGEAAAIVTAESVAAQLPSPDRMPSVKHVIRDALAMDGDPGLRALDQDRQDTCAILYTSATTGRPKGVMLTHENVTSNIEATNHHLRMTPEDRGLCALPLFHCFGQNFIMNALVRCGGALVLLEHERAAGRDKRVQDEVLAEAVKHRQGAEAAVLGRHAQMV